MSTIKNLAAVALAGLIASPLSAQIVRNDSSISERVEAARRRAETARSRAEAARTRTDAGARRSRGAQKIPPGHLPPRGMCRVWIEGVPPGQQPAVTDCATAEQNRTANSRVIYGDRESFPGQGKGKFKNRDANRAAARQCSVWDGVVVDGRVINVCRDSTVPQDRRGRGRFEVDSDDDDDRFEDDDDRGRAKLAKSERKAAKAARKANHGGKK